MNAANIIIMFLGLACAGLIIFCWWQDNQIQGLERELHYQQARIDELEEIPQKG